MERSHSLEAQGVEHYIFLMNLCPSAIDHPSFCAPHFDPHQQRTHWPSQYNYIYIEIYVYNIIITIICVSEVHYRTGPMVPWFTERAKGRAVDTVRGRASAVVCGGSREAWQTYWPGSAKVPVAQQRTNWLTRVPMAVKSPAFLAFCGRVFSKMRSRSKKCAQFVPYFSIQIP